MSAESINEAYKVISSFTGVLVKNSFVNAVSVNQPINDLPAPNDSGSLLIVSTFLTVIGATDVPSPASNVTVTSSFSAGLFSLYVNFAGIVFFTPFTVISLLAVTFPLVFCNTTSSANMSVGSAVSEITAHKKNDIIFLPCFFLIPSTIRVPPDKTLSVSHRGQSVPPCRGIIGVIRLCRICRITGFYRVIGLCRVSRITGFRRLFYVSGYFVCLALPLPTVHIRHR